jgi:predicted MFS family arabinose efflux permease
LIVLSGAFFFIFMGAGAQQQFLIPYLKGTTNWGAMKYSSVLAAVYLSFMVWRIFVGYSIRALGDYRSIVLGCLTYTAFVATVLFTKRFPAIIAMGALWGWGAASMWIVSSSQILNVSHRTHYGTASGIFYFCTHVGFTVGVLVLSLIQTRWDSDALYQTALGLALIGNAILLFVPRRPIKRDARPVREILKMMRTNKVRIVAALQFAAALGFGLLLGVFADFISDEYGNPYLLLTVLFPSARAVLSLSGGILSDRLGRAHIFFVAFLLSALGLFVAAVWTHPITVALSILALGFQGGIVPTVSMALIGDSVLPERRHLAFGAIFVWRDLGVVIALLGGQFLRIRLGGVSPAFLLFGAIFLVCALLSTRLARQEQETF